MEREIPLFTLEGVKDAEKTTHYVTTGDKLGISLLRFLRKECDDVVVIIHGLTTSTDMFIMPEHYNLVSYLLDNGLSDVFTFDFRMSNRHPYNLRRHRYTMDDCALYDMPAGIEKVREVVGPDKRIHVICHCLGSMSFVMSLFAKQVTVRSVIANSVALTPRIKTWSRMKISLAPFVVEYILNVPYLNPLWPQDPGLTIGKIVSKFVDLYHHECDVSECHMLSMMWGTGWPALYKHENLLDVTHRRGGDLYGGTSMNYYRHVMKCIRAKHTAVKYKKKPQYDALPDDYFQYAAEIETPVLFMTGKDNNIFTDSNIVAYNRLEKIVPGRHQLHIFDGYGHQDVFMGKNNHIDVFPRLLEFINQHRN